MKENDKVHVAFSQEYYRVPWDAIRAFDLVVNTNKVSPDLAVTWVVNAVKAMSGARNAGVPTLGSLQIDPILKQAVSDALKCKATHK